MDAGLLQSATKYGMDYLALKDHNAFAWLSLNPLGNHWIKTLDQNDSKETNPSPCSPHYGTVFQWLLHQGRVVRKPVNVNPGLNVNWSISFSCLKMFFSCNVLCSLRLLQLRTEEQTMKTEYLTKKLQFSLTLG